MGEIGLGEHHIVGAAAQHLNGRVLVALPDRAGQILDRAAVPPGALEPDHTAPVVVGPASINPTPVNPERVDAERTGDVGQHGAGLHRGELVGIADQHQPSVRTNGLQQPGHHGQRHHRHLVDHDHVVRQPVAGVVTEPTAGAGQPAEQPVQGDGAQLGDSGSVLRRQLTPGLRKRLGQPGRRLAGWCRQGDPWLPTGLVGQHRQHLGNRGGLPGAGPAGQHGHPLMRADLGGPPLQVFLLRTQTTSVEQPIQRDSQPVDVDLRWWRGAAVDQLATYRLLLSPIALQIELSRDQSQWTPVGCLHPIADGRTPADLRRPVVRVRPRQLGDVQTLFGRLEDLVRDRGQVDADRAEPQCAHRESQSQSHPFVRLAADPCDGGGHVYVGQVEHPCGIERGEQSRSPAGHRDLSAERCHSTPRSSSSDSSVIRAAGGCQLNTPYGTSSIRGVAGPAIPRKNR